jgi:hypothetical protein
MMFVELEKTEAEFLMKLLDQIQVQGRGTREIISALEVKIESVMAKKETCEKPTRD